MSGYVGSKRSSSLVSATEITLDGAKLKSSGDSITKSDGTTAVLSESSGTVTFTTNNAVIEGSSSGDLVRITQTGSGNALVVEDSANPDSTPFVVTSIGRVGVGTIIPTGELHLKGADQAFRIEDTSSGNMQFGQWDGSNNRIQSSSRPFQLITTDSQPITLYTNNTERMRIDSSGHVLIGTTNASTVGENLQVFRDDAEVASFLRYTDGTLVNFKTGGGAIHGSISISGVTCSYNSFAGSHWSQLKDGSKSEILCGTVMEAIDELVEWPNEPPNSNLCKVKISDNAGTKKVYGVFMGWDEDWTATNDMLVTALGAFLCRVNSSEIVHQGDLLESNGDGTARVQSDDVIRSSTIGKVTSTAKTLVYDDGSYCVPTVLYCG